jgi:anti-sigma-K factor RskA
MTSADDRRNEASREWGATTLQAYYDDELGFWARRRVERQLTRSPELRRALAELESLGNLMRESEAPVATPDLWGAIAHRLPAADAGRRASGSELQRPGLLETLRAHVGAVSAAGAAAAAALAFVLLTDETAPGGVIHWVDGGDRNVMLLDGEDDVTVIWVFDADAESAAGGGRRGRA